MKILPAIALILSIIFFPSCNAPQSATDEGQEVSATEKKKKKPRAAVLIRENNGNQTNSLTDYLRRIPGLQVSGNDTNGNVKVSGITTSLYAGNSPLFVLNGVKVGHELPKVARLVVVSEIQSVRVLKNASETSFYGTDGANGVIVIKMKK